MAMRKEQESQPWKGPIPQDVMSYWGMFDAVISLSQPQVTDSGLGYKFETLSTLPAPWGETSREYIEGRDDEAVSNKAQYCSVVRTGIGKTILCLGGEVDAGKALSLLNLGYLLLVIPSTTPDSELWLTPPSVGL